MDQISQSDVKCFNTVVLSAPFNQNDDDPPQNSDNKTILNQQQVESIKGILKQRHKEDMKMKHVDFNMDIEVIPFDKSDDIITEIQIIKEFPKKIVSYRELFKKMAEEKKAAEAVTTAALTLEEESEEEENSDIEQNTKFSKLVLKEPGVDNQGLLIAFKKDHLFNDHNNGKSNIKSSSSHDNDDASQHKYVHLTNESLINKDQSIDLSSNQIVVDKNLEKPTENYLDGQITDNKIILNCEITTNIMLDEEISSDQSIIGDSCDIKNKSPASIVNNNLNEINYRTLSPHTLLIVNQEVENNYLQLTNRMSQEENVNSDIQKNNTMAQTNYCGEPSKVLPNHNNDEFEKTIVNNEEDAGQLSENKNNKTIIRQENKDNIENLKEIDPSINDKMLINKLITNENAKKDSMNEIDLDNKNSTVVIENRIDQTDVIINQNYKINNVATNDQLMMSGQDPLSDKPSDQR